MGCYIFHYIFILFFMCRIKLPWHTSSNYLLVEKFTWYRKYFSHSSMGPYFICSNSVSLGTFSLSTSPFNTASLDQTIICLIFRLRWGDIMRFHQVTSNQYKRWNSSLHLYICVPLVCYNTSLVCDSTF